MMPACAAAGALLLVMLTVTYSNPVKQGFDPSYSYSSGYDAAAAPAGAVWDLPSETVSNSVYPEAAPRRVPSYPERTVLREQPAAASYSSSSSAPGHPGYASNPSAGSTHASFQPISVLDTTWEVAPPSPFSGGETSRRPSARRFASSKPAPESPSNVSPPGPFLPKFEAGELSQSEQSFEHGNYESETQEQGFQPPPRSVAAVHGHDSTSDLQPSSPGGGLVKYPNPYPYYDYMFLTGQYPPGTVTHSSSSYEQGMDHWRDADYIRYHFPANPSTQQIAPFPAYFEAPQSIKQPVKQNIGGSGYSSHAAATGQYQPHGAGGLQGSYGQPATFEQPHRRRPAGGYGRYKVGH